MTLLAPRTGFAAGDFPILPSPIDRLNPLARDLVLLAAGLPGSVGGSRLIDWIDPGPNGKHGTLTSMDPVTAWIPADDPRLGWALDFSAGTDHVTFGDVANFDGNVPMSVCVWVKADSGATNDMIVAKQDGAVGWNVFNDSPSRVEFNIGDSGDVAVFGSTVLSGAGWKFVAVTYTGGGNAADVNIYVDGKLEAMTTNKDDFDGTPIATATPLRISGRSGNVLPLAGAVSLVFIHSRVLSPSEVAFLFVNPLALLTPRSRTIAVAPVAVGTILPQITSAYYRTNA